jgi:repressor LexA
MSALTQRQKQVLDFVVSHVDAHDVAPSLEEIAQHLGLSSVSNAHQHVDALIRRGYLRRGANRSRDLEVVRQPERQPGLPFLGTVSAGRPIEGAALDALFDVGAEVIARGDKVIRVRGDLGLGDDMRDGDYLILQTNAPPQPGDRVMIMSARGELSFAQLPPAFLPDSTLEIVGVIACVVRLYGPPPRSLRFIRP